MARSFLALFADDSSLLDLNLFDVLAESILDGLDDIGLLSLEGVEVFAFSDFEFGDFGILLDEDGCMDRRGTFFGDLAFLAGSRFVILEESEEFLGSLDFLRLSID